MGTPFPNKQFHTVVSKIYKEVSEIKGVWNRLFEFRIEIGNLDHFPLRIPHSKRPTLYIIEKNDLFLIHVLQLF